MAVFHAAGAIFGVSIAAAELAKDTKVSGGALRDKSSGEVIKVGVQLQLGEEDLCCVGFIGSRE